MTHATAAVTLIACASQALAGGDIVSVPGIVRDFHKSDATLATAPSAGNGHYARNVSTMLNSADRPVLTGTGFRVSSQWRDSANNNIAPHLANVDALYMGSAPAYDPAKAYIDSWDSETGTYGGGNAGPPPAMLYPATMPTIVAPTGLPTIGALSYGANTTPTLSSSFKTASITAGQNSQLTINGHITIHCTGNFTLSKNNQIKFNPNSSLKLYVGGKFFMSQGSLVNMVNATTTANPANMQLYAMSSVNPGVHLNQDSKFCGQVYAPNCSLQMDQNDHFYGSFWGKAVAMDQGCGLHFDGPPQIVCGVTLVDQAGTAGAMSTGGIPSPAAYESWFTDHIGVNASTVHVIDLVRNSSGVYEFIENEFFPIDNQIFGNEGQAHNFYYTFSVEIYFTHKACSGGFVEFRGADDCWIAVGSQLGIDLGGVMPLTTQRLDVDRLELVDGQMYALRVFYAQRNSSMAQFHLRTNLDLINSVVPGMVTAAFD